MTMDITREAANALKLWPSVEDTSDSVEVLFKRLDMVNRISYTEAAEMLRTVKQKEISEFGWHCLAICASTKVY